MDSEKKIESIEKLLRTTLPSEYRSFLLKNVQPILDPPLKFPIDGSPSFGDEGLLDELQTASEILENDCLMDPDARMLIIGHDGIGGYLYVCFGPERFGQIFYRVPYKDGYFYEVGSSFDEFMSRTEPNPWDET